MIGAILALLVVVAADLQRREDAVGLLPRPRIVPAVDRRGDRPRRVDRADVIGQHPRQRHTVRASGALVDFIADAPHDDARMVAIPVEHAVQVALPPVVEAGVIVAGIFAHAPAVEGFVDDEHPEPVAGIQERGRGRIVRAADRVEAAGLEDFDLACLGAVVSRRSHHAVIVVDAATLEQHRLSIEQEARLRVEVQATNAERRRGSIHDAVTRHHHRLQPVQRRRLRRP